jgi:hypothetical protein
MLGSPSLQKGIRPGGTVWYERACLRFIRELSPRRLKQAQPEDVIQFLGLLAQQPEPAAWNIRHCVLTEANEEGPGSSLTSLPLVTRLRR